MVQFITTVTTIFITVKFTVRQTELRRDVNSKFREAQAIKTEIISNYETVKVVPFESGSEIVFYRGGAHVRTI